MERSLKERLIGAAVLVAVAIILIPEMLSGPSAPEKSNKAGALIATSIPPTFNEPTQTDRAPIRTDTLLTNAMDAAQDASSSSASAEADLKSFTIDLRKSDPQTQAAEQATDIPSPLPPQLPSTVAATTPANGSTSSTAINAVSASVKDDPTATGQSQSKSTVTKPNVSAATATGWAVQLASLGTRASADQLANELKKDGIAAFVMPFESKGKTLYRVRLGPLPDRASAELLQAKVKRTHSAAAVVPHP